MVLSLPYIHLLLLLFCSVSSGFFQQYSDAVTIDDIFGAALENAHAVYRGGSPWPLSAASPQGYPVGGLVLSTFEEHRQQLRQLAEEKPGNDEHGAPSIAAPVVVLPVYITAPSHNGSIAAVPNAPDGRLLVRVDIAFSHSAEGMIAADEDHHLCVGFFRRSIAASTFTSRGDDTASKSPSSPTRSWPPAAHIQWCGSPRRVRSFELAVNAPGGRFRTVSLLSRVCAFDLLR